MSFAGVNYIAVVIAALASFGLGAIWYRVFATPWMHAVGKTHSVSNVKDYNHRIEAINYTLAHDDGVTHRGLEDADIVLVGVSRSGKTPTSLYLALQFGVKTANYPLIPEDFARMELPQSLRSHKPKLYGLTIAPERLREIRHERRPNSRYSSMDQCVQEVGQAEGLYRQMHIPFIDTTRFSVEEISTRMIAEMGLTRRFSPR